MPNRKPIAAALAALSLAGTGHALAGDTHKNEIEILSISAPSSGHAVGASEPLTVGGARTRTVPTTPLDDARLVSRGPVAGASDSTYEVYMPIKLENTRVLPVKGPQLKAETGTGGGDSTVWVRMAQPHTTTSVMPPRLGWEVQVDSAAKTALPGPSQTPRTAGDLAATPGQKPPSGYMKYKLEDVMVSHVSPPRTSDSAPPAARDLAPRTEEQKYMEFKLKEVLISGVIANGNPAQSPKSPGVPPSPASTGLLKFEGGSGKPAIAINTPLRTVISGSPVAGGSSTMLMAGEKLQRQAPSLATPTGRR